MRILLTNDDGIYSPALLAMARRLREMGEVHVVAPESVQSATGHGITISSPILTNRFMLQGDIPGTAIAGRPADCVKVAVAHLLPGPADLVVSGINAGTNVGINVIYSGTVAAAVEAAFLGLRAVAVSQYLKEGITADYDVAAARAMGVIQQLLSLGLRPGQVANINLPALPRGQEPKGIAVCRQCTNPWVDQYERRTDPRGRDYFWNKSVFTLGDTEKDTDVAALREGYITVTPLHYDLTDRGALEAWKKRLTGA
jgi:5'-nucleotidase